MFSLTTALANKLLGATTVIALLLLLVTSISKNETIRSLEKTNQAQATRIETLRVENNVLALNAGKLEQGLAVCNASVADMHTTAERMDRLGAAAVAQIQQAGAAVEGRMQLIEAMAGDTCEDAFNILKAGGSQ